MLTWAHSLAHTPHNLRMVELGVLVKEFIDKSLLYSVSDSNIVSGPLYTYSSGTHFTTVDNVLASQTLASQIEQCYIADVHELNSSDHLPIVATLTVTHSLIRNEVPSTDKTRINWREAIRTYSTLVYASQVNSVLRNLINKEDIQVLTNRLLKAAEETLPDLRSKQNSGKIYDPTLRRLCAQSRKAFWTWKNSGRPRTGEIFEAHNSTKKAVRSYLNKHRTSELQICWKMHFCTLGNSNRDSNPNVMFACHNLANLDAASKRNEDLIFDAVITTEEVIYMLYTP